MTHPSYQTCSHGSIVTGVTSMFTWYADGCAITRAAMRRGEQPKPRTIIENRD